MEPEINETVDWKRNVLDVREWEIHYHLLSECCSDDMSRCVYVQKNVCECVCVWLCQLSHLRWGKRHIIPVDDYFCCFSPALSFFFFFFLFPSFAFALLNCCSLFMGFDSCGANPTYQIKKKTNVMLKWISQLGRRHII